MRKSCDLDLWWFKVIRGQRSRWQSTAYWWYPIQLLLTASSYLSPVLRYVTCNFDDLEPVLCKVIQGRRSWCQSIVQVWFHIRLLFL